MALGLGRLFFHRKDLVLIVELHHTALHELLFLWFIIAHYTGCFLLLGISHKFGKREIQHIVTGDHQQVIVQPQLVNGKLHVTHSTKPGLIAAGSIVHHLNILLLSSRPVFKMMGILVIADDHISIHQTSGVNVIHQPVQYGLIPYLQQGFGKVFGQWIQAGCVSRGQNQALHISPPSYALRRPHSRTDGNCTYHASPGMQ